MAHQKVKQNRNLTYSLNDNEQSKFISQSSSGGQTSLNAIKTERYADHLPSALKSDDRNLQEHSHQQSISQRVGHFPNLVEEAVEEEEEEEDQPLDIARDDVLGQYSLELFDSSDELTGSATYLQGDWHEDLLKPGFEVEAFVTIPSGEEDWKKARIERVEYRVKQIKSLEAAEEEDPQVRYRKRRMLVVSLTRNAETAGETSKKLFTVSSVNVRIVAPEGPKERLKSTEKAENEKRKFKESWTTVIPSKTDFEILTDTAEETTMLQEAHVKKEESDSLGAMTVMADKADGKRSTNYKGFELDFGEDATDIDLPNIDDQTESFKETVKPVKFKKRRRRK